MKKLYRFPGTRSFSAEESSIFFGRNEDIANMRTSVIVDPTTVLFGRSGTGKSSLIQAGLIPALQKGDRNEAKRLEPYLPVIILPKPYNKKGTLNEKVIKAVRSITGEDNNFLQLPDSMLRFTLWYTLKQYQYRQFQEKKQQVVLLIFDQAEELFTYPDEQIEDFVQDLCPVIGQIIPEPFEKIINEKRSSLPPDLYKILYMPIPVNFIFPIRSDKLHLITRLKKASPHILQNTYELLPLTKKQAIESMDGPSQHEGKNFNTKRFTITADAKDYIFQQLSDEKESDYYNNEKRIDPFSLQIICSHLEKAVLKKTTKDKLQEQKFTVYNWYIEKETGAEGHKQKTELPKPAQIIRNYYVESIEKINMKDEERHFIESDMLRFNRRTPVHESLMPVRPEVLKELINARILKKDYNSSTGGYMYEITHDCFIKPMLEAKQARLQGAILGSIYDTINKLKNEIQTMEVARNRKA